jgi:hypothetical protein
MATPIKKYTVSIDDTLRGKCYKYHSDDLPYAERYAERRVGTMESANAVVTLTATEEVISVFERINDDVIVYTPEEV